MRQIYLAVFCIASWGASPAMAANYATCILDKAPAAQNDVAAHAIMQSCLAEHPGGIEAIPQGSGRGVLGFKSGAECTAKTAVDTRSNQAATLVGIACRRLYDEPQKLTPFSGKLD